MNNNNKSGGTGCAVLILGIIVLGLALWGIAIALQVLGFGLIIGGPIVGIILAVHGWHSYQRSRKVSEKQEELQEIAADARRALDELQLELDYLTLTKGIGAYLAEPVQIELIRVRANAESTKKLLEAAPNAQNLREAIVKAEEIRLRYHRLLPDEGF